ncbi:hypothetical protein PsorP6_003273 [Peronosclerospora sorghi]|uniref:Uncharacterized protein n=1 Tax=Peronosclerospora sorghi TaxID=230839 RepID=A0ACC0VMT5_9STRA|nr:hypothetical protein PsorP6_003273 [Peronosclerospora sorghi]
MTVVPSTSRVTNSWCAPHKTSKRGGGCEITKDVRQTSAASNRRRRTSVELGVAASRVVSQKGHALQLNCDA